MGRSKDGAAGSGKASSSASSKGSKTSARVAQTAAGSAAASTRKVTAFYSDRPGKLYREFSNFYRDAQVPPFKFVLPEYARREGLPEQVECKFSEKAIMLVKAALMGDAEAFKAIAVGPDPKSCKDLGRKVKNFDEDRWTSHLEETAYEVVRQKFTSCKLLRDVLLSTGDSILAEAAPNDSVWGIGLKIDDERVDDPSKWCGQNALGRALMQVRSHLRGEPVEVRRARDTAVADDAAGDAALGQDPAEDEDFLRPVDDLEAVRAE